MTTHIIIPDSHAHPDYNNDRFEWLGKLIYDVKPDAVIDIGDSADMPSLCSYDTNTPGFDQRSFLKDCESYQDAMDKMWHQYRKHKRRFPRRYKVRGNHENRVSKAERLETTWKGLYSIRDLKEERFNDEVYPFLKEVTVDGVVYNHYAPTEILSRPIGGVHTCYNIIKQKHKSYVVGHSHTRDFHTEAGLCSLCVGCFLDYEPEFAGVANDNWWRGVVILRDVDKSGYFDHEWINIKRLKREYSK